MIKTCDSLIDDQKRFQLFVYKFVNYNTQHTGPPVHTTSTASCTTGSSMHYLIPKIIVVVDSIQTGVRIYLCAIAQILKEFVCLQVRTCNTLLLTLD